MSLPISIQTYDCHTNHRARTLLNPDHVVTATESGGSIAVRTVDGQALTVPMSFDAFTELIYSTPGRTRDVEE